MSSDTNTPSFANMRQEQLPIPRHQLHGWTHFVGLYAAEHVAATEFVIGATFVALGASTMDIVVGLLIGNVLAILSWTFLARKYGAAEKYPEEEAAERKKNAAIEEYQAQQALSEGEPVEDHSLLSKVLRGISLIALAITLVLAARVMFWSADASVYEANRDTFYRYGFVCTVVYFVFAYWALRRRLALNK